MITIWGKQDGGCALSTAGEPWHTCVRPESHGTQQRCWRRSRSPQRVCDAMRCRDKPESRTARSVPNRLLGASGSNRGRRAHSLDQASAGPECCLVQKSIGAVSLARRQKTGPIPQPVSPFVCLTWGNNETFVCVWSLVVRSRVCFRKYQVGGGFDAASSCPARDQIVLLPVSCVPPSRPTGHLGPPRDHCGLEGGATLFPDLLGSWRARGTPQAVCVRQSTSPRVLRCEVDCGWGGVTRGSCRTSGALEDTSCVSGPLRSAPCAASSFSAREVAGTPGHSRAPAQLAGTRRPPALCRQRPPARHQSRRRP